MRREVDFIGWKKTDTNRERKRERDARRMIEKRREGLGDCVRERGRAEWRVQTRSGHGTSCCARSIERSYHLCYTPCQLWRINTYTRVCVYVAGKI